MVVDMLLLSVKKMSAKLVGCGVGDGDGSVSRVLDVLGTKYVRKGLSEGITEYVRKVLSEFVQ